MLSSKVTAIILKRSNFGEADKIVTAFSREKGKIVLIAKGVRRIKSRRAPHLEPLTETELVVRKNLITDAKGKTSNFDLKSLSFALYAAELIDKLLPEGVQHEQLYDLFKNFLLRSHLDENWVKEFTLQVLWNLGFLPPGQFPKEGLNNFVEQIAERRIRSKKLIDEI